MSSLYYRCSLELDNKRTVERSMMQAESLLKEYDNTKTFVARRLDLFFTSGMNPIWVLTERWSNLMFSLGLVKGALEVFTKLGLWENVIMCYNVLNMKHKVCTFHIYNVIL